MDSETTLWYETEDGMIVCRECRDETLTNWSPAKVREMGGNECEMARPGDFQSLGRTPWAGNPEGERYMQCDGCNGQWGPDA